MVGEHFFKDEGFLLLPPEPWRERDGRIVWFGKMFGFVHLNIFGIFGNSRRRKAVLQLFHRLTIQWEHQNLYPLGVVKSIDLSAAHKLETPLKLACGSYINELVRRCYSGIEESYWAELIAQMDKIFSELSLIEHSVQTEKPIRQFEASLLSMQGYAIYENFPEKTGRYRYSIEGEWIEDDQGLDQSELQGLQHSESDLWQTHWDDDFRLRIKRMHRLILFELLGDQPLQVRRFFGKKV